MLQAKSGVTSQDLTKTAIAGAAAGALLTAGYWLLAVAVGSVRFTFDKNWWALTPPDLLGYCAAGALGGCGLLVSGRSSR
jgi:hypothetical protein